MKMGIEEGEDHDVQNILELCVSYLDQAVEIMKRFSFMNICIQKYILKL